MFDLVDTLKKVFSKRYFVIFFDKENLPLEGTRITIGNLTGILKEMSAKTRCELSQKQIDEQQKTSAVNSEPSVWECRKCHFREVKK